MKSQTWVIVNLDNALASVHYKAWVCSQNYAIKEEALKKLDFVGGGSYFNSSP
jgi:hypothetical protein